VITNEGDLPDQIVAKLVAGVAIPVSQMPSIIQALAENYNRYQAQRDETSSNTGNQNDRE
jgi:hypothetical protein